MLQTDKVSAEHKSLEEIRSQLQLVLLDFGLAEELTPRVRKHFISFLHMISSGNGRRAAHHMLLFSTKQVQCSTNRNILYIRCILYCIALYYIISCCMKSYYIMSHDIVSYNIILY